MLQGSPERHSKSAQKAIHVQGLLHVSSEACLCLDVCAVSRHGPSSGSLKPQDPSVLAKEATWHHVPSPAFAQTLLLPNHIHDLAMSTLFQES